MTIHISSLFTKAALKFGDCQLLSGQELFLLSLARDSLRWASNAKRVCRLVPGGKASTAGLSLTGALAGVQGHLEDMEDENRHI